MPARSRGCDIRVAHESARCQMPLAEYPAALAPFSNAQNSKVPDTITPFQTLNSKCLVTSAPMSFARGVCHAQFLPPVGAIHFG